MFYFSKNIQPLLPCQVRVEGAEVLDERIFDVADGEHRVAVAYTSMDPVRLPHGVGTVGDTIFATMLTRVAMARSVAVWAVDTHCTATHLPVPPPRGAVQAQPVKHWEELAQMKLPQ